ncbi:tRNA (adenine(58)-N(1))-methyltransferase catalytic subunit trmt61a [Balamuthia mandrillaris]
MMEVVEATEELSLPETRTHMREGDQVIFWAGRDRVTAVTLKKDAIFCNKFGDFHHNDAINHPFGIVIRSKRAKKGKGSEKEGFVYVLRPTPELFTAGALQHRTQIIYTLDISVITLYLELKPGSRVLESGTGSGSLSRAFARTIAPTGHLHTFEFHEVRATEARKDFAREGLSHLITVTHRDVCSKEGFGMPPSSVDAVFLDLPSPWEALDSAADALRSGGRLCTYAPCVEQVQKVCEKLRELGFSELQTIEVRLRPYALRTNVIEKYDFSAFPGFGAFAPPPSSSASSELDVQLQQFQDINEEDEENEKNGGEDNGYANETEDKEKGKKKEEEEEEEGAEAQSKNNRQQRRNSRNKRGPKGGKKRTREQISTTEEDEEAEAEEENEHEHAELIQQIRNSRPAVVKEKRMLIQPVGEIRGHTSFLTFARK